MKVLIGTSEKPKSRKQIIKWLQEPYSDAAEYKMWGNGEFWEDEHLYRRY